MLKIEDVEEFHRAFGHPIAQDSTGYANEFKDATGLGYPSDLVMLRTRLIEEEAGELLDAQNDLDPVLYADALFDLLYVTLGAIIALGVPREIGDIVHKSNMSKGVECQGCNGRGYSHVETFEGENDYIERDYITCPVCKGTKVVPILREDGKVLKGPNWIDDKPLIAQCIEEHCRDWDKDADQ